MNNFKMLGLLFVSMIAYANNTVDITLYITGDYVDENGQTLLHVIASKADEDDFTISLKLFDFLENNLEAELKKIERSAKTIGSLPQELGALMVLGKCIEFVNAKDKNGHTALAILQNNMHNRSAIHPRQQLLSEMIGQIARR